MSPAADILHLDVMDGTFVPNISFGFSVLDSLKGKCPIPMDAHLMVVDPARWFERIAADGVSMCSFHLEAAPASASSCLNAIRSLGMKAGLAINPDVPVESLFEYIGKADYFLLMSVYAGFGGQKFIPETLSRVSSLKEEIRRRGFCTPIQVDGGVYEGNIREIREAGVDIAVAGSAVFRSPDPVAAIRALREE